MNTFLLILLGVVLLAMCLAPLAALRARDLRRAAHVVAINTAPNFGTHKGVLSLESSAAIATRYLIGKIGADEGKVAVVSATADQPLFVITDEASAAGQSVACQILGVSERTIPVVAAGAFDEAVDLYATAAGKVSVEPTVAGTYWRVGKSAQPSLGADQKIEMIPCEPERLVVVAALTAPGTAAGSDPATTQALANALKADVTALGAALAVPAKVKVLAA